MSKEKTRRVYAAIEKILFKGGYAVIDTNVLLQVFFERTKETNTSKIIARSARLLVTPQLLAELFNLKNRMNPSKQDFDSALKALLFSSEKYVPKNQMLSSKELAEFGVTDLSLLEALNSQEYKNKSFLITDDAKLCGRCQKIGLPAISSAELDALQ